MLITVLTMETFLEPVRAYSRHMGLTMSQWGFPLIWGNKYVGLCFLLIFIFAVAVLPENTNRDQYVIGRIGIENWLKGQFLWLITFAILYSFFLAIIQNILLIGVLKPEKKWGKGWGTLVSTDVCSHFGIQLNIPSVMLNNESPGKALLWEIVILALLLIMIGSLIIWLNLHSRVLGILVPSALIFWSIAISRFPDKMYCFSPVNWIQLNKHCQLMAADYPGKPYIVCMLILLTVFFFMMAKLRIASIDLSKLDDR